MGGAPNMHALIQQRGVQAKRGVARQVPAVRERVESVLSPVALAVAARGVRYRIFSVSNLLGVGKQYIGVLYGTGKDVEAAFLSAHKEAMADADSLASAKIHGILHALTCDVDRAHPERLRVVAATGKPYPAFQSARWIRDHLHPDEQAALMHLVAEVRAEFAPAGDVSLDEDAEAWAADLDAEPEPARLAQLGRADLTRLTVALARRLAEVVRARDVLMGQEPPCA